MRQVLADRDGRDAGAEDVVDASAEESKVALLVEDDPLIRITTADMVRDCGYTVIESANAETALEILRSQKIDVLITDIGLSGMSGQELAWSVHRENPQIKIILATGHNVASDDLVPGAAVLAKPFDERRVAEALNKVYQR